MIVVCHPGADFSTADVHRGLLAGLRAAGEKVATYELSMRLSRSGEYFRWCWRKAGRPDPKPTTADIAYLAGKDLVERALRHDAEWVLVVSGMFLHPDTLVLLRRAGRKVAVLLTESPYDIEHERRFASLADLVWTNERTCVETLRTVCHESHYLPHAWSPGAISEDVDVPAHDVVFVGTGFQERIDLLSAVDWSGIDVGIYGSWANVGSRSRLRAYLRGGVCDTAATQSLYRRARIGLNIHRQSAGWGRRAPRITTAESLNPRAYELAAAGCFTVSDWRPEVGEVFGDLVPTFRDPHEAGALIRRWLADDAGRTAIQQQLPTAVAGQTWDVRARQVLADLARVGARRVAA